MFSFRFSKIQKCTIELHGQPGTYSPRLVKKGPTSAEQAAPYQSWPLRKDFINLQQRTPLISFYSDSTLNNVSYVDFCLLAKTEHTQKNFIGTVVSLLDHHSCNVQKILHIRSVQSSYMDSQAHKLHMVKKNQLQLNKQHQSELYFFAEFSSI
jgi:hypothetical protein